MDSSEIYKALYRYYHNYEYKLSNAYICNWESDFFGMSKAGYFIEVEVKVSRNDYFRDFIKEKHRFFRDVLAGKTHTIERQSCRGDKICEFISGTLISQYGEYARYISRDRQWSYERHNGKVGVWANDYGKISMIHPKHEVYAQATLINFREIEKINCPNQLYFACPVGLIKPEEVPDYAGLLYVDSSITMVKKAPYLHKRKQDLKTILLSKFYNLWNYKVTLEKKIEIGMRSISAAK